MSDPLDSTLNLSFTYHYDKYSCITGFYFAHVIFNYIIALSGLACFLTRVIPAITWTHVWFGRFYIVFMLWSTATSLLIHNTGLPPAVLISFLWVLSFLTIGWWVINVHQILMARRATRAVATNIKLHGMPVGDLVQMIADEKARIAASKTFTQRLFSLKALHGILMFTSWMNIVGRIFASKISGDYACFTYPYYKQADSAHFLGADQPLTPVPVHDPHYARLPWAKTGLLGWGLALSLGPLLGATLIGALWSALAARKARSSQAVKPVAPSVDA